MVPASPPLPTTCSLPFQFSAGSQTSNWMAEVGAGLRTPWTWQKAGSSSARALPRAPGMLNGPAATNFTAVMVVSASGRVFRASQLGAAKMGAAARIANDAGARKGRRSMGSPVGENARVLLYRVAAGRVGG